jgi:hypothetical protein
MIEGETNMRYWLEWLTFSLFLTAACVETLPLSRHVMVTEASGIARLGDTLLLVGDDADGKYFEFVMDDPTARIFPIEPSKLKEVAMPHAELAMDLESIDILADGRLAILSEQLHCLIAQKTPGSDDYTVVAEYDKMFTEFANRGLEGLAVKDIGDGGSRVAVLWEGGYPQMKNMNPQLRERVGRFPLKPVVIIHELKKGEAKGWVSHPQSYLTLEVPEPEGEVPIAQRFRGSDILWHSWHDREAGGKLVEGFIVLLSSENSPPDGSAREYKLKLLQRYGLDGRPVGEPLDLTEICRDALNSYSEDCAGNPEEGARPGLNTDLSDHMKKIRTILEESDWQQINWEGLGWFEKGKSLVSIYDTYPLDPPFAMVLDIPEEWK